MIIEFVYFDELIFRPLIVFSVLSRLHFFNEEKVFSGVFSDVDFVVTNFDRNKYLNLEVKLSSYLFSLLISLFSQSLLPLQDH